MTVADLINIYLRNKVNEMSGEEYENYKRTFRAQVKAYNEWVLPFLKPRLELLPKEWKPLPSTNPLMFSYGTGSGLYVIISGDIESDGNRWIHLSVSRKNRLPHWNDIKRVKHDFLGDDSSAIQVFPPTNEWVNHHEFVLDLWTNLDSRPFPDFRRKAFGLTTI